MASPKQRASSHLLVIAVLMVALGLRLYGILWDGGNLFHPDERRILMVVDDLSFPWPPDWRQLLSAESPWNPQFFSYGSLPIYLLRLCASLGGRFYRRLGTLHSSYLVGRVISALFDVGTVYLIYRLGRALYGWLVGLLGALLVALTVLHIQLSHFYAVDTLLTFFVVLTVWISVRTVRGGRASVIPLGVAWGMAMATKVSALPLALPILLAWVFRALVVTGENAEQAGDIKSPVARWVQPILGFCQTGVVALITFLVCQPYAAIDALTFAQDVFSESYMARGLADIPYTRQYIGTLPYLYPAWQMVLWSLGLPLGLAATGGLVAVLIRTASGLWQGNWARALECVLPLSWVVAYFGIVGSFHAKFARYMLPIIPILCLWAAWVLVSLTRQQGARRVLLRALGTVSLVVVLGGTLVYTLAFLQIYRHEHTWLQATEWICRNVPAKSRLMVEHWDDPLPLIQAEESCYGDYRFSVFPAYDPDDEEKLDDLLEALETSDYIVLSSNRLYNTIPRLPLRYPMSSRYYQLLMSERLGFELVYYAAVYPEVLRVSLVNDTFSNPDLPRPRLLSEVQASRRSLVLGRVDESFTVYDHPKPLVFQKVRQLSRGELLELFGDTVDELEPLARQDS